MHRIQCKEYNAKNTMHRIQNNSYNAIHVIQCIYYNVYNIQIAIAARRNLAIFSCVLWRKNEEQCQMKQELLRQGRQQEEEVEQQEHDRHHHGQLGEGHQHGPQVQTCAPRQDNQPPRN